MVEKEQMNEEMNEEMMDENIETSEEATETAEEVTEEVMEEAVEADGDDKTKKSFFKKKKDKKDEQIEELNDRLMRNLAEFENYRKRTEKEKSMMFEMGAKDIIEKVLPVIDNFERGLNTISDEEREGAFAKGIEAIYKQLLQTLESAGVKQIDALGKEFDPNFHNAVMHEDNDEVGENIIVEEFQKGYIYRETVVRHSMVKVAN